MRASSGAMSSWANRARASSQPGQAGGLVAPRQVMRGPGAQSAGPLARHAPRRVDALALGEAGGGVILLIVDEKR